MLRKLRRLPVWLLLEALIFIAALTIIDVFDEELKALIGTPKTAFVKWLVIGIAVLLYLIQQAKRRDRIPREELTLKIIELHLTAIYGSENLPHFRAYVMIPDVANRLQIKARYNMKREQPDYHLNLAIAAGTAGRVYNQRRTIAADLNRVALANLHLSPEEAARIWPEVRSLLSIPMVNEAGETVRVVTFDSTLLMQETGFYQPAIQTYLKSKGQRAKSQETKLLLSALRSMHYAIHLWLSYCSYIYDLLSRNGITSSRFTFHVSRYIV